MKGEDRTKEQLLGELEELHKRVNDLESSKAEYKLLAGKLRESEERYRDLFENANDLIQCVDAEGRFVYVNKKWLETLAPEKPYSQYKHNGFEDNADAHLKRTIMGREVVIAVTDGKLDFGPWEQIFYGEFDGMRKKRVLIKIIGE